MSHTATAAPASEDTARPASGSTSAKALRKPELLAPAGNWECAKAAVENGADAIYFGLEHHNARLRADNFTEADLPVLMAFLHQRGVRGYVCFNTLVFAPELTDAERQLRALMAAGVDAALVQDVGICRLIRQLSPDFPIHASTQMTLTSAEGVRFVKELGCSLAVLSRECSLGDLERIRAVLTGDEVSLELFVHGALCVAYSGQCLTSEALGGRSANRGVCAQACRLPYELVCDGQPVPLGDRRYLLSPQDLATLELLPDFMRLGIASVKIEGRLKSAEYVAAITRIYRAALDKIFSLMSSEEALRDDETSDAEESRSRGSDRWNLVQSVARQVAEASRYEMEMAFSRGLGSGWLRGTNHQDLVHARFGKKRGVYLGEVAAVRGNRVVASLTQPLNAGDGVVFDSGRPDLPEEGGRVYGIAPVKEGGRSEPLSGRRPAILAFGAGAIDFARLHVGDRLWKTNDPALERQLRQTFAGERPQFRRPIAIEARGLVGQPLTLTARDEFGREAQAVSALPLTAADRHPLTTDRLTQQLGRLGGTPFRLGEVTNLVEGSAILPVSELNRLRRELVKRLEESRAQPRRWTLRPAPLEWKPTSGPGNAQPAGNAVTEPQRPADPMSALPLRTPPQLHVMVRSLGQLEAALGSGANLLYCDFENPKQYRQAVKLVRAAPSGLAGGPLQVFVAPPRITKPGEEWILRQVRSSDADGYLVRNYDHLTHFAARHISRPPLPPTHEPAWHGRPARGLGQDAQATPTRFMVPMRGSETVEALPARQEPTEQPTCRCVGDYSLNVANQLTAEYFMRRFKLDRVTASYDLNLAQLEALLQSAPPEWVEVTIHQHMPMFHMEYCVFCAYLSHGTDYTNCGRPCERHDVRLRDRAGIQHPVKADAGCRNTVFNGAAQTAAEYVSRLIELGARHFRIEFLDESPPQVNQTIQEYARLLRGETTGRQLWQQLKLAHHLGVTRGPLGR